MSLFTALIYDSVLAQTEQACLQKWRQELLQHISGDVLEIGAGTGANLAHYPASVNTLVLSEPDPHMRNQLRKKLLSYNFNIIVSADSAENIEAEDETYDHVVTSLVCCSVSEPERALLEIRRVLKPHGHFIFLEHVAAARGSTRRRWQNLLNPLWRKVAGNCHLNRETETAILAAGFSIQEIKRESMCKAMPLVRPTIRGIAVKHNQSGDFSI